MTKLALVFLLTGCTNRALDIPTPPLTAHVAPQEACCVATEDAWYCKDDNCPELRAGEECTTLAAGPPNFCQVPTTDYCVEVYLEKTAHTTGHVAFQTVYCF